MESELNFCLKRFADDQVSNSIKHISQLERNLGRKRTYGTETSHQDEIRLFQQKDELVKQFSSDVDASNLAINEAGRLIETEFHLALRDIRNGIESIAQISSTKNEDREKSEEIRAAITKIRQQSARVDSELAHLFQISDSDNCSDHSARIIRWFRQHYGYANDLNRLVGKYNSSGQLPILSEQSRLVQAMFDRVNLWNTRYELINQFIHQMDEDSNTGRLIMDSLYRVTDTFTSRNFLRSYADHWQERSHDREEHLAHKTQLELDHERMEQQTRIVELVSALCQLSVNTTNEFQLNKKLRQVLRSTEDSKEIVPFLVDQHKDAGSRVLILRLKSDHRRWISNKNSIQQQFCQDLCESVQLPRNSLRIEGVEQGSVILHIVAQHEHDQLVHKRLSDLISNHSSSQWLVLTIEYCCVKLNCRVHSIVFGQYALPIEQRLMHLKWDINTQISLLDSFDQATNDSPCPEGWKRFNIQSVQTADSHTHPSWYIAYHGSRGFYAPFILTSGMRVSTQHRHIPESQQTIYLSPSIEYAAHPRHTYLWRTATSDSGKHQHYQLVFQCRVNPRAVGEPRSETLLHRNHQTIQIDKEFSNDKLEWLVQSATIMKDCTRENIVCCALMLRRIEGEPKDLPVLSWWKNSHSTDY